ncbi:MAG: ABC transporter substrate-binding protein [Actinobacteria bacterium]|nr:ABC transporter substrate-binding protein [Actinomycetota bacterium]
MPNRTRIAALLAAGVLVLGACSANESDDAGSDTPDTTSAANADAAPGVTADSIKIGVTYPDLDAIRSIVDLDHGDYEAAYQAVIDDVNDAGGIDGRMIEPVFAPISPIPGPSADEACVELTEDEEVFAVVGALQDDQVLCYLEDHETAVIGGVPNDDRFERAAAPWFTTEGSSQDSEAEGIAVMADAGELDGTLGVFGTTQNQAQTEDGVLPQLDDLGIDVADSGILDAPADDGTAQNQATGVVAERFRSAGVDRVLAVGSAALPLANGLAQTDYRPELRFTSLVAANAYAYGVNPDTSILDGSVLAAIDNEQFGEENMQTCVALVEDATGTTIPDPEGLGSSDPNPFVSASAACRNIGLFVAIATAAGPDLNYGTFQAAGEALDPIQLPGSPDPYDFGAYPDIDGNLPMYLYEWDGESFTIREDG